jgi:2,3-dihydroxybiphenyl 1,2-dioxygenase
MTVSQFGYLGLGVKNMDAWEEYASEVLGLEVSERAADGTVYLRMDEYHHRIALLPNGADDLAYVGWQCLNHKEFDDTKAALLKGGVEYSEATPQELAHRRVRDMIKFDVAGIPMEVFFGPTALFEKPFNTPVGMRGFNTGELGLGHVGMNVDDPKKAAHILEEGLGFLVSDNFGGEDRFFHCNPREHTAVIGRIGGNRGPKRIGHFMVEVNHIDDVGFCHQRVEERNIEIKQRLGRHSNDHMLSFYMVNPSGFQIEYGWGGRKIDDKTWQVNRYETGSTWRSGAGASRATVQPTGATQSR